MTTGQIYLTPAELAARLRLQEDTVYRWRLRGEGPIFLRAGRRIVYDISDVLRWEASRKYSATSVQAAPE